VANENLAGLWLIDAWQGGMHRRSDREINRLPVKARSRPAGQQTTLRGTDRELQALGYTVRLIPPAT
jgi:hypothetical protein